MIYYILGAVAIYLTLPLLIFLFPQVFVRVIYFNICKLLKNYAAVLIKSRLLV